MKKRLIFALSLCLLAVLAFHLFPYLRPIASIKGPELDRIVLGDAVYRIRTDLDFSYKDKGRFLGIAAAGDVRCRIYSVKGDNSGQYLYRLWDWEGAFYEREPGA